MQFSLLLQKGKEFGYFPMDTVHTEEVFVTKEIEVPTKVNKNVS